MRICLKAVALGIGVGFCTAGQVDAQPGSSAATPFQESSAGRAMQRITFGAIDCAASTPGTQTNCDSDAFTTSDLFVNGTYKDARLQYGGSLDQADVSNSLLLLFLTQTQTFPSPSTASGFTFTLRGKTVPTLESELFGPLFGERALTNGLNQLSFTFNIHTLRWSSLDAADIRVGESGLLWGDTNYDSAGGGYVGICRMDINTTIGLAALNYGVLDNLDLSAAFPIVHTSVEGSNEYLDFIYSNGQFMPSSFAPQGRYYVKGSSTGLGDVVVGAKYALLKQASAGAAVTVRSSLPTGSLEDMTGTGEFQTSLGFIGSFEREGFSPHVNIGYLFAAGEVSDEVNYTLGASYRAVPNRLTVSGEFIGRRVFDVDGFTTGPLLGTLQSPVTGELFPVHEFVGGEDGLNLFLVALGGKVRLTGQWLASVYAVLPAGSSGLQVRRPTFNLGINYAR